ncbi:hypothetical protein GYMLUDRAFT_149645 [Collybiopsis luxurians FD-317 M1]|nr:hypothetical protein GYMLUDRAFT_149645 [Collybiopsis luxurians FD-317 M1]
MTSLEWHKEIVQKYNSLPRKRMAPSGLVPNTWHFDLRYIPISPPAHMLFIIQKESQFVANQTLPVGKKDSEPGLIYFPETAKEAALEICLGLMHQFLTNYDLKVKPLAPWALTTDDRALAKAVQEQFKALGVKEDRCKVDFVGSMTQFAHTHFEEIYKNMKTMLGFAEIAQAALSTPQSISFSNLLKRDANAWAFSSSLHLHDADAMQMQTMLDYFREFANNEPRAVNMDGPDMRTRLPNTLEQVEEILSSITLDEVRKKADAGDAQQAVDAALRLKYGIKCTQDRILSRQYLIKAALDKKASPQTRSMAHSMLIFWYIAGHTGDVRARYMFAASYHADEAIRLVSENTPVVLASPNVLCFASRNFEPLTSALQVPELLVHFKWVVKATDQRTLYMKLEQQAAEKKMMKRPNRYRCANVGCGIESDTGKMLSQCSGKCDRDKKPSYCSKAGSSSSHFRAADWKNHKPFCRPGAPCSVIDTTITPSGISQQGSIRVPVHHADGTTTVISTSTMDPEMLKQMRDVVAERGSLGGGYTRTEIHEIDRLM